MLTHMEKSEEEWQQVTRKEEGKEGVVDDLEGYTNLSISRGKPKVLKILILGCCHPTELIVALGLSHEEQYVQFQQRLLGRLAPLEWT